MRRALDVVAAALLLIASAPLAALAAALVKLSSPGPVLFHQERRGRGDRPFVMFKFRTMVIDADSRRESLASLNTARGAIFKIRDDPRRTVIGAFLRRTSLDELPQLLNVIRGEMSIVGPRPLPEWVVQHLRPGARQRRGAVTPGMTGLWQVRGRVQDSDVMLADDLAYVEGWSWWLDVRILARTPAAILRGAGRYDGQ